MKERRKCKVARQVDGDTIRLHIYLSRDIVMQNCRCRLARINTPELHDPDPAKRTRAQAAAARTAVLCPVDSEVFIDTDWLEDDYGRLLVDLLPHLPATNGILYVNDMLLQEGLADPWPAPKA